MKKIVVLCSGGLDSSTLVTWLKNVAKWDVYVLFVNYGQLTASREYESARMLCFNLEIPFKSIDLTGYRLLAKSKLLGNLSEGEIDDPKYTEVPGRNAILLSLGAAYAQALEAQAVAYGAHYLDAPYPDCSPKFVKSMNEAIVHAYGVEVRAPFLNFTKVDIVKLGMELLVDFDGTYSCYVNAKEPCGECGSCKLRIAAIKEVEEVT